MKCHFYLYLIILIKGKIVKIYLESLKVKWLEHLMEIHDVMKDFSLSYISLSRIFPFLICLCLRLFAQVWWWKFHYCVGDVKSVQVNIWPHQDLAISHQWWYNFIVLVLVFDTFCSTATLDKVWVVFMSWCFSSLLMMALDFCRSDPDTRKQKCWKKHLVDRLL